MDVDGSKEKLPGHRKLQHNKSSQKLVRRDLAATIHAESVPWRHWCGCFRSLWAAGPRNEASLDPKARLGQSKSCLLNSLGVCGRWRDGQRHDLGMTSVSLMCIGGEEPHDSGMTEVFSCRICNRVRCLTLRFCKACTSRMPMLCLQSQKLKRVEGSSRSFPAV